MPVQIYKIIVAFLLVNICLIFYTGFTFFNSDPIIDSGHPLQSTTKNTTKEETSSNNDILVPSKSKSFIVEIWSKAAIGQYIWENVLRGNVERRVENNLYIEGTTQLGNVTFKFRSGPSLKVPSLLSFRVENIILILNWRNNEKINYSIPWIDAALSKDDTQNVGIIALGDEQCNNRWVLPFLNRSNKIKFVFVVYDWNKVDNRRIFQWPLGLATYRTFPSNAQLTLDFHAHRPYVCNFIATIYPRSSRQELYHIFETNPQLKKKCLVKTRLNWKSEETGQSMAYYVEALKLSELTLSPIGMNHECYRILEAVEYGSIPVVEQNLNHTRKGFCDRKHVLRIFKHFDAPFIYVHNWTLELPAIIERQILMSESDKRSKRVQLIKWYHKFKINIRNRLVETIQNNFI